MKVVSKGFTVLKAVALQPKRQDTPPTLWRRMLTFVAVGKATLGGAGAALALAGAFNIAAAITAQHWLHDIQRHYLDYVALGGGAVGCVVGVVSRLT